MVKQLKMLGNSIRIETIFIEENRWKSRTIRAQKSKIVGAFIRKTDWVRALPSGFGAAASISSLHRRHYLLLLLSREMGVYVFIVAIRRLGRI